MNISTARREYQSVDDASATSIAQLSPEGGAPASGNDISRFSALQLPSLPGIEETQYTLSGLVTAGIDLISPFDEALSSAIGIKPAADYLSPLVANWETLQPIGKRIGLLSINDFVISQNLTSGTQWLQSLWSKDASQAFGDTVSHLSQLMTGRSDDLDSVSKIVEYGGAALERLVYNQAMGLSSGVTQPMSFLGFTLPLGVWAQTINRPMRDSIKSEITAAIDSLKATTVARQASMTDIIDKISSALQYSQGRSIPKFDASDFELPEKIVVNLDTLRYGFGGNTWWEDGIASAC
ncbi:hypothetical protein [Nocardia huaxiensis]|uniref:hypothetical protein n=1 Tax=Nocardia huaxiensis TaxID=2755382 RepID=UPI001E41E9ED|nr:hypothetical protein [Nocardia huaxiensis]UFS97001.1 hypothetical protein LPY97_03440 [Nocardia huaxiensis]